MKKKKAIGLFSGGLDSTLALKIVKDMGIDVIAVNINMGFGSTNDRKTHMQSMCDQIGVELHILDVREDYLKEVLFNPKHGYGKNFNPCIDCHGFMFRNCGDLLKKFDADFLISGEVLGQRPMSQRKDALDIVKNISTYDELIVRPLSAKLLEPSLPETSGWIDREKLLDISGRSRQRQLQMAKDINLIDFESPGGGCLLTDENFSKKLRDFVEHDTLEVDDIDILKSGRHLRLENGAKLVIGRDKDENEKLKNIKSKKFDKCFLLDNPGPLCLLEVSASVDDKALAAKIIITYAKTTKGQEYSVEIFGKTVKSFGFDSKDEVQKYLV